MARIMTEADLQKRRRALVRAMTDIELFSRAVLKRPLRRYQLAPARAIVDSVLQRRGLTLAVMMPRQAGKNETAAQVEAFLLNLYRRRGGFIVKAAPTFAPQALNSLLRLETVLANAALPPPVREQGHIVRVGQARAVFYSAAPEANVVGATANILLEGDEAQDIDEAKWDKDFRPMAASTAATTVLWGTAWTAHTLLAQAIRALHEAERRDGQRRVFTVSWEEVAAEVPAYRQHIEGEIARLGADHPLIQTQYLLQEIDAGGGLFPREVQAMMRGSHPPLDGPLPGEEYALLVDVAGEAEERGDLDAALRQREPRRDSTAVTIVAIDRSGPLPRYRIVARHWWTGRPQHALQGAIARLAERWGATRVVVDATGLGAGLASFLRQALGPRVTPFVFTSQTKSELGWALRGLCASGRLQDYAAVPPGHPEAAAQTQFWRDVAAADYTVDGAERRMRWGVADPTVHDDLLISAALCAVLEREPRPPSQTGALVEAEDVL
ncbi:MAG: hypothetical protein ABFD20_02975 [Anaerolineales bacterium]